MSGPSTALRTGIRSRLCAVRFLGATMVIISSTAAVGGGWHATMGPAYTGPQPSFNFGRYPVTPRHYPPPYVRPWVQAPFLFWYTLPQVPEAPPPPPPSQPTVVYIEREPAHEQAPTVIIVQQPAPEPPRAAPVVAAPPPPPPVVAAPVGPRTPGPDVFHWTDADGVLNYSTRVPVDVRAKAKKLATLTK